MQQPGVQSVTRPNSPSAALGPHGASRADTCGRPGAHLDQMHFARTHEVEREPIKRAVMPVAVGCAGGGAGVESALERAALAHAETHAPRPACRAHRPPHSEYLTETLPTELSLYAPGVGGQQISSTSNRRLEGEPGGPCFM